MFNRLPFNRGNFNRTATAANSVLLYGNIDMVVEAAGRLNAASAFEGNIHIGTEAAGRLNAVSTFTGNADMVFMAEGFLSRSRHFEGEVGMGLGLEGDIVRVRNVGGDVFIAVTADSEGFNTFRYETISLGGPGFSFRAGDELIIDMENMTVTMNGQNIMRFLDRESEFFNLNPGNNEITYESTAEAGRVDLRILWKDAWL